MYRDEIMYRDLLGRVAQYSATPLYAEFIKLLRLKAKEDRDRLVQEDDDVRLRRLQGSSSTCTQIADDLETISRKEFEERNHINA